MTEEESFVILGSSPTESMDNYSIIQKLSNYVNNATNSISQQSMKSHSSAAGSKNIPGNSYNSSNYALGPKEAAPKNENGPNSNAIEHDGLSSSCNNEKLPAEPHVPMNGVSPPIKFQIPESSSGSSSQLSKSDIKNGSLASSFLLGEIDENELRENIFKEFPSLCGKHADPRDLFKLQKFMSDYIDLKNNIAKSNASMRHHFTVMQKWQTDINAYKEEQENHVKECQGLVAKLRNENMELQKELNTKMEQIEINERAMKKENEDLVKLISEKSSVIENMRVQIEKLEQNHYSSFDYVERIDNDKDPQQEYIRVSDHQIIIKSIEKKLSEVTAEKLELEDMKKIYIDEIDCLKVNLTAAEELLKKTQADISLLKSKDCEKSQLFEQYDKEKEEMKQEITLLRTQLEVYCKDFGMERAARENLAGEKDQLLADLKLLQRRNQQLIEEASARLEKEIKGNEATPAPSFTPRKTVLSRLVHRRESPSSTTQHVEQGFTPSKFVCPLCDKNFKCLDTLQTHVQDCLDKV